MRRKRICSLLLCFALLLSLLPCQALAAEEPASGTEEKNYSLLSGSCRMSDCAGGYARYFYSDGYFDAPSGEYNEHLATMSLNLAMTTSEAAGDEQTPRYASVRQLLADIGCAEDTIRLNKEGLLEPTEDSIAFTMGYKTLAYADGTPTGALLLPIAVRGGGYGLEWCSNFTVGASGEAAGFASAADQVSAGVEQYLTDYDLRGAAESGQVKFWLVGYSRGAAVANLAAKRLADKYGDAAVYAYTWETPLGGVASAEMTGRTYSGIHNICNYADIVTLVAPAEMGFKRYGTDHSFPSANAAEYAQEVAAMREQLSVVAPSARLDDSFTLAAMSMHSIMSTDTPIYPVSYTYSGSVNHFAGDYLRLLVSKLQTWSITSRQKYASQPVTLGTTRYPTMQTAVTSLIAISENTGTVPMDLVLDAIETLSETPGFAVWLGAIYTDVITGWNKVTMTNTRKQNYIDDIWSTLESSGMLQVFDETTRKTIKRVWPTVACTLFPFTSTDSSTKGSSLGYRGIDDSFMLTATLVQNAATLAINHVPVYSLAWARSFDSFYSVDTPLPAPELLVSGEAASTEQSAPTPVRLDEAITLEVPTAQEHLLFYTLEPLDAADGTHRLYSGDIALPTTAGTVYRLTAYAVYDGLIKSDTATYFLTNAPSCLLETQRTDDGVEYRALCVGLGDGTSRIVAATYEDGRLTQTLYLDGPALSGGIVSGVLPLPDGDGATLRVFLLDDLARPLTDAQ